MADPRRQDDDEPLTQLDVDIDKQQLDSLIEREATTSPGGLGPETMATGADDEPQTMEPPRVMGVPRLRAHTIHGVAPPSSGATAPPTTQPEISSIPKIIFDGEDTQEQTETKPGDIPKIAVEGDDEQTTMVGKLLAEAHAQVAKRLKEKEADLYADETATTVGDAEKLIAAANAAAFGKGPRTESDEVEEPTESRSVRDALMEDTTSRRDAIDIDGALARAAELRAEAERKKKQAKKRTMHGLGDGPLKLPARAREEEIPTNENKLPETGERPASTRSSNKLIVAPPIPLESAPADGEMETLSAGVPQGAPMRKINTEPETMPVHVPSSRERLHTAPADPAMMLVGSNTPEQVPFAGPPPGPAGESFQQTLNLAPGASPYTQPMPYAPTVRMDDGAPPVVDRALRQTMNSPMQQPAAPITGPLPQTPTGGVPHYHSTPMPVLAPQYSMQPNSGPAAFAQTAIATGSGPAVVEEPKKKKSGGGLVFFFALVISLGGLGYWQRAVLKAMWDQYRNPAPAPTTAPTVSAAPSTSAALTPPPVTTESAVPTASASASAAPQGSSSAAPHGSSSAAPRGSASAAPSSSASTKPPVKKPPPWRPPPKKPTGGGTAPKPVPKPIDENRGF